MVRLPHRARPPPRSQDWRRGLDLMHLPTVKSTRRPVLCRLLYWQVLLSRTHGPLFFEEYLPCP